MGRSLERAGRPMGRRWVLFLGGLTAVFFMANLSALIDHIHHPEIPYLDEEHLIVGGLTALVTAALLGFAFAYIEGLRKNKEWMNSVFEASTDSIHVIDTSGRILRTNRVSLEISGYEKSELVGKCIYDFFTPASRETFGREFPVLLGKGKNSAEVELVRKDGAVATLDCHASAIRDGKGKITSFLVVQRDITERKTMEQELRKWAIENARLYEEAKALSLHDPLTGLANRRLMGLLYEQSLAMEERHGMPFSLVMADIDFFKGYNDSYGHPEGDRLLAKIAGVISKEIRKSDLAVRYGGEEFLIVLQGAGLKRAKEVSERIRKAVESKTGATISLGVASHMPGQGLEGLISTADKAMYEAKRNGRNRVACLEPDAPDLMLKLDAPDFNASELDAQIRK